MPSADFCLLTGEIAPPCAIGFIGSLVLVDGFQYAKALIDQSLTGYLPIAC